MYTYSVAIKKHVLKTKRESLRHGQGIFEVEIP